MKHGRMSEQQAQAELSKFYESRRVFGDACVNTWASNSIGGESLIDLYTKDADKARRVAMAVQFQEQKLKSLSETVVSTAFGNSLRPEHLLRVVYLGTANSLRGDFCTELPLQSTDDALFYIRTTRSQALRGATAGERIYENVRPYYAGETQPPTNIGTGDGTTLTFVSNALSPLPMIPFWTKILVDGAVVAIDNGSGTLVGDTLDTTALNSVDENNGIITLNFKAGYAPAYGAAIEVVYNWSSENSANFSQIGHVGIELIKERFNARPMPLGYSWSDMTQLVFDTTGLGSARDILIKAVADEHSRARDQKAIADMRQIANGNPQATFNTDFASVGEVSLKSHAQKLLFEIGKVSTVIYDKIEKGKVNKIIAGSKAAEFMKLHDLWTDDNSMPHQGVYKAGTLSDIDVYVCPANSALVNTNQMILGYKNPEEGLDVGLVYGTVAELNAELRYPQQYTEGQVSRVEDKKIINKDFYRLMTLTNL